MRLLIHWTIHSWKNKYLPWFPWSRAHISVFVSLKKTDFQAEKTDICHGVARANICFFSLKKQIFALKKNIFAMVSLVARANICFSSLKKQIFRLKKKIFAMVSLVARANICFFSLKKQIFRLKKQILGCTIIFFVTKSLYWVSAKADLRYTKTIYYTARPKSQKTIYLKPHILHRAGAQLKKKGATTIY